MDYCIFKKNRKGQKTVKTKCPLNEVQHKTAIRYK